jgi:hypothetical protein
MACCGKWLVCLLRLQSVRYDQRFSNCGPRTTGGHRRFRKNKRCKICNTERMKNTALHVCAKAVSVTLATGVMVFIFSCIHFRVRGILQKNVCPCVRRPPVKWAAVAESLRNTGLDSSLTSTNEKLLQISNCIKSANPKQNVNRFCDWSWRSHRHFESVTPCGMCSNCPSSAWVVCVITVYAATVLA